MTRTNKHNAFAPHRSDALPAGMRVRRMGIVVVTIGGDPAGPGLSRKGPARTN